MKGSIRDRLRGQPPNETRKAELHALASCLGDDGPLVVWLHGPGGTGKSRLVEAFADMPGCRTRRFIHVDCQSVEPTPQGLLACLQDLLDDAMGVEQALATVPAVMVFDNYQAFRLADSWLRREFIPALCDGSRVVLVSREPPSAGWVSATEWQPYFSSVELRPLRGQDEHHLVDAWLMEASDAGVRADLETLAVVRRITRPLLEALCPDRAADELFEKLAGLSSVERRRDGLAITTIGREGMASRLLAKDPEHYRQCQQRAWTVLREQMRQATRADLWRSTADIIYLLENPVIREAFFPSASAQVSVEPASPGDENEVLDIAARHDTRTGVEALRLWWQHLPTAFHSVRDASGRLVGFYCAAKPEETRSQWLQSDPVARIWQQDLKRKRDSRLPALFIRRWLSREDGESPSPVQAAAWVDIKRTYLELRPELRRVYMTLRKLGPFAAVATELGFEVLDDVYGSDEEAYYSAMLDFGPGSVDGWICDLLAAELGITDDQLLDSATRELNLDGRRIPLTPLEFGVVAMLESRPGQPISRDDLLLQVWGRDYSGGSNVVDAVVRGLRKKCGEGAAIFETVRGVGYRLRA